MRLVSVLVTVLWTTWRLVRAKFRGTTTASAFMGALGGTSTAMSAELLCSAKLMPLTILAT